MKQNKKLWFASDYQEGACPKIMERLMETNYEHTPGYGTDSFCEAAKEKIRTACACPDAEIFFLTGGTQTNQIMIDTALKPWQGVIAAQSGHVSVHEAGAIEFTGHKVLELPHRLGKLGGEQIERYVSAFYEDSNRDHMVAPGMVYLSQPTEYGTIYSLEELKAIRRVCDRYDLLLYIDGARLAYALACPENDVTLPDLAGFCDIFYIGGTKCGALFGEAVVIPRPGLIPHLFTMIKQHGALLAKGRLLGIQFDTLFTDGLYFEIGNQAQKAADRIREALTAYGYELSIHSPTNQIFVRFTDAQAAALEQEVDLSFWEKEEGHVIMRIATSWATRMEDVEALIRVLARHRT